MKKLPVWQLDIDETDLLTGVDYVALVDQPAIMRMWQAFSEQKKITYQVAGDGRHIVQGPLMIPDLPIYRQDETHGEHYVIYTKQSIEKIARKFFRLKHTGNVNLMHAPSATLKDAYMFESFIIDQSRGTCAPKGFENLPDGTWFGSYMIENDALWKEVQAGTFKGFSVEGFFNYMQEQQVDESLVNNLIDAVTQTINGTSTANSYLSAKAHNQMLLSPEQKSQLKNLLAQMGFSVAPPAPAEPAEPAADGNKTALLNDGTTQVAADNGFVQGSKIFVVTDQGKTPAPDGQMTLDDGTTLDVTNGTIMNVTPSTQETMTQEQLTTEVAKQVAQAKEEFKAQLTEALKPVVDTVTAIASKFEAVTKDNASVKETVSKLTEANKQVFTLLQKLDETPATTDVTDPAKVPPARAKSKTESKIDFLVASMEGKL